MDQKQSVALWKRGKEAWNAWADEMLSQKVELEKSGTWQVDSHSYGQNEQTNAWILQATANFHEYSFEPSFKDTAEAILSGLESKIDFNGFVFPWIARFDYALFKGIADFGYAYFCDIASFDFASFSEKAKFRGTLFEKGGRFEDASFDKGVGFWEATFEGIAHFWRTHFCDWAWFQGVTFGGKAWFGMATFDSSTSFRDARFGSTNRSTEADFTGAKADRAFDLTGAIFSKVPTFSQADFKQVPDLDNVDFPLPGPWGKGDKNLISKYRHIRRLAIQGHDYEREYMAFKGELRSRRGNIDYKYGLGFWYDLVADSGRSIWRPFLTWLAALFAFSGAYLWNAGIGIANWRLMCWANESSVGLKALSLSIANAVPVIGSSRPEEIRTIYACLYGVSRVTQGSQQFNIPAWSPVIQVAQNVLSATLIFLFLLAIRNQFKIK